MTLVEINNSCFVFDGLESVERLVEGEGKGGGDNSREGMKLLKRKLMDFEEIEKKDFAYFIYTNIDMRSVQIEGEGGGGHREITRTLVKCARVMFSPVM